MKSLPFIITPILILIGGCILLNATWPYYIVAFSAGTGFGFLAWLTYLQLRDSSDMPKIKFENPDKYED